MDEQEPVDIALMMASIVHDVKNSLGLIQFHVEELAEEIKKMSPQSARKLQRLSLEAGRINNAMVLMLGIYRLEERMLNPIIEEHYLADFIEDVRAKFNSSLEVMNIELITELEDEELTWFFDQQFAEGIISNVITNAIRYTDNKLELRTYINKPYLVLELKDNGAGYPAAMLECLTDHAEMSFKNGSTGLGLYFSNKIAQLHHADGYQGRIELLNDPVDGGALFRLYLP